MAFTQHTRAKRVGLCIWIVCFAASLTLLAIPVIGDAWTQRGSEQAIASVDAACTYDTNEAHVLLDEAQRYNDELAGISNEVSTLAYEDQLALESDQAIGWVEIPRINVRLPIYHGTDEATLSSGVGHVEGTSLPVGGTSSNCALAAHTGMSFARMFDNIGALVPGDLVIMHVLGRALTYEIEESFVVWPWEMDALEIEPGRDLVTLITCTPYGVNDHRLIVRAARTERVCEPDSVIEDVSQSVDIHSLPLIAGVAIALCTSVVFVIRTIKKRKR